mmetsp:Transcript_28987/g.69067  ORF Transcript_28987/g.69067 Transcript_28987/m.69067 type:complete len:83 (-) Transcript_28987:345-593(-)
MSSTTYLRKPRHKRQNDKAACRLREEARAAVPPDEYARCQGSNVAQASETVPGEEAEEAIEKHYLQHQSLLCIWLKVQTETS